MARQKKEMTKQNCREFELDLTDYVTGDTTFLTKEKQEALFEHLAACKQCQKEFWSWKDTWAMMVGKSQSERPEFKAKMEELMKKFREQSKSCQPGKDRELVNVDIEIGRLAGVLWKLLGAQGEVKEDEIHKHINSNIGTANQALGWLEHEKKVIKIRDTRGTYICLTENERMIYKADQKQ